MGCAILLGGRPVASLDPWRTATVDDSIPDWTMLAPHQRWRIIRTIFFTTPPTRAAFDQSLSEDLLISHVFVLPPLPCRRLLRKPFVRPLQTPIICHSQLLLYLRCYQNKENLSPAIHVGHLCMTACPCTVLFLFRNRSHPTERVDTGQEGSCAFSALAACGLTCWMTLKSQPGLTGTFMKIFLQGLSRFLCRTS